MKLTINIKDNKAAFFLELLKNLEFVSVEKAEEVDIETLSDAHKAILDERLASYQKNPNDAIDWEQFEAALKKEL